MDPHVVGCVLGTAVGDALGLPFEGLTPTRAHRLFSGPLRYRFLLGRGMVSDDTEHTLLTLSALQESGGDVDQFRALLARGIKRWLLGVPAGAGLATVRASARLLVGFDPTRSGVPSAGNGAAMRAAVIGAWYRHEPAMRVRFTEASSRVTHTDVRAVEGAQQVAQAAACSARGRPQDFDPRPFRTHPSWSQPVDSSRGVSGYVVATVRAALDVWLRRPRDFTAAITEAIELGGDTDTTAAIVGGIVGAGVGEAGIPTEWIEGLWEWPRSVERMRDGGPYAGWLTPFRNAVFLTTVLGHGFRRLLPPY